ncbi:hypothetical protein [Desulfonema magnum]|nr:hypothetical protein [Desulfonema magnum]
MAKSDVFRRLTFDHISFKIKIFRLFLMIRMKVRRRMFFENILMMIQKKIEMVGINAP